MCISRKGKNQYEEEKEGEKLSVREDVDPDGWLG